MFNVFVETNLARKPRSNADAAPPSSALIFFFFPANGDICETWGRAGIICSMPACAFTYFFLYVCIHACVRCLFCIGTGAFTLVCFPALSNDSSPADYSSLIRQRRLAMAEAGLRVSMCTRTLLLSHIIYCELANEHPRPSPRRGSPQVLRPPSSERNDK